MTTLLTSIKGSKYFLYWISTGKEVPYIDTDLRKIIWKYAEPLHIKCCIKDRTYIKLYIDKFI